MQETTEAKSQESRKTIKVPKGEAKTRKTKNTPDGQSLQILDLKGFKNWLKCYTQINRSTTQIPRETTSTVMQRAH